MYFLAGHRNYFFVLTKASAVDKCNKAVRCEREKNKMELMSNSEAYLDRIAILRKKIKSKISRDGDFPNSDVLLDKIDAIEKEFIKDIEKSKIEGRGE